MIERFMLDEKIVNDIKKITGADYSNMLKVEDIEIIIKDLICEYNVLEERLEDGKSIK